MARLREDEIENPVVTQAKKEGWYVRKLTFSDKRGAPDRLFIKGRSPDGVNRCDVIFMEFKRPGAKPNGIQKKERDKIHAQGGSAYVVDSLEEAWAILDLDPAALQKVLSR